MRGNHSNNPFARNPASLRAPLSGIPLFQPARAVMGWTEVEKAVWCLQRDRANLEAAETSYAHACRLLGQANRRKSMRRTHVAQAFRYINQRRGVLRQARRALEASLLALAALAPTTGSDGRPAAS
jgi:hypothetical protein